MSHRNLGSYCLMLAAISVFTGKLAAAQSKASSKVTTPSQTRFLNPDGLNKPAGYMHVVVAEPGKLVYVSGQVAWDATGQIVGKGDIRAQITKALENLKVALTAGGATMEDLIKVSPAKPKKC